MTLWDEAAKITLLGMEVYQYGFFCALGMLAGMIVMAIMCRVKGTKTGTAPVLTLLCLVLGAIVSRIGFCLMNQELGRMMPLSVWFDVTGGGWSMIGTVAGVLAAAALTGKITGQSKGRMMDIAAAGLPAFMVLERIGEEWVEEFNYSRALEDSFLNGSFLTFSDFYGEEEYLATWRLAAIFMFVLLVVVVIDLYRERRAGDTCILFLILYGAMTILLESLRYDRFLSITFVHLEQVLAAVILFIGVLAASVRYGKGHIVLVIGAMAGMAAAVGGCIGLEFALDRTTMSRGLIYALYVALIAVPAVFGLLLRKNGKKQTEQR